MTYYIRKCPEEPGDCHTSAAALVRNDMRNTMVHGMTGGLQPEEIPGRGEPVTRMIGEHPENHTFDDLITF